MGSHCAPLVAEMVLFCYERNYMISVSDDDQADILGSFCCGSLLSVFGVRVSVTFHLTCAHIRLRLLCGHLLGNSCSFG